MDRRVSLALVLLVAPAWAGVLTVGGLWIALNGPGALGVEHRWLWVWLGAAAFFGGQFVFQTSVGDRIFPHTDARVHKWLEAGTSAALLVSVVVVFGILMT